MTRAVGQKNVTKRRTAVDLRIREIFEQEARTSDALRKAIRYMFEYDPIAAVNAYVKLTLSDKVGPESSVTNVFTSDHTAARLVANMEALTRVGSVSHDAPSRPDEFILPADADPETH